MKVTQIAVSRKIADGNYGNRGVEIVAELDPEDDPAKVLRRLQVACSRALERAPSVEARTSALDRTKIGLIEVQKTVRHFEELAACEDDIPF